MNMVSAGQKLNTTERWHNQNCLFQWGDYGNIGHSPKKSAICSSPVEDGFCSSGSQHDRRKAPRTELVVSVKRLQEQRPQPQKTVLCLSPNENGFQICNLKEKLLSGLFLLRSAITYRIYSNIRRNVFPDSHLKNGGSSYNRAKSSKNRVNVFVISNTVNICLGWVVQLFHCIIFFVLSRTMRPHV
jgi:hypothetical protein